jgi:putative oxidoreductase
MNYSPAMKTPPGTLTESTRPENKVQVITLRIITGLLFVWMMVIGVFKLIGTEPNLVATFSAMHYLNIMPFVGIMEILGGIGVMIPRVRVYAAIGLLFLFFGGLASHLASATYLPMAPLSAVAMLLASCVIKLDGSLSISSHKSE